LLEERRIVGQIAPTLRHFEITLPKGRIDSFVGKPSALVSELTAFAKFVAKLGHSGMLAVLPREHTARAGKGQYGLPTSPPRKDPCGGSYGDHGDPHRDEEQDLREICGHHLITDIAVFIW
jgi:hypothetical protein